MSSYTDRIEALKRQREKNASADSSKTIPQNNAAEQTTTENSGNTKYSSRVTALLQQRKETQDSIANRTIAEPESFHSFGGKYIRNADGGYSKVTSDWRVSERDRASRLETGHDTLGADLSQAIRGGLESWKANQFSTLATIDNVAGAIREKDNYYQPEVGSAVWKQNQASSARTRAASNLLEGSKEGRGKVGQVVMDVASQGVMNGIDAAIKSIPIVGQALGTVSFMSRSFGGKAQEMRDQGKSVGTQVLSGVVSAAIEQATESMWTYAGVRGYTGKAVQNSGPLGQLATSLEAKLAEKAGPVVSKLVMSFGSEAVEEMLADVLNPVVGGIVDKWTENTWLDDFEAEEWQGIQNMLYDGLVGGLSGIGGGLFESVGAASEFKNTYNSDKTAYANAIREEAQLQRDYAKVHRSVYDGIDKWFSRKTKISIQEAAMKASGEYVSRKQALGILADNEILDEIYRKTAKEFAEKNFANVEISKEVLEDAAYNYLKKGDFAKEIESVEDAKKQIESLSEEMMKSYLRDEIKGAKEYNKLRRKRFFENIQEFFVGYKTELANGAKNPGEALRKTMERLDNKRTLERENYDFVEDEAEDLDSARHIGYGLTDEENIKTTEALKANEAPPAPQTTSTIKDRAKNREFLTKAERDYAKANGLDLREYAKQLAEEKRKNHKTVNERFAESRGAEPRSDFRAYTKSGKLLAENDYLAMQDAKEYAQTHLPEVYRRWDEAAHVSRKFDYKLVSELEKQMLAFYMDEIDSGNTTPIYEKYENKEEQSGDKGIQREAERRADDDVRSGGERSESTSDAGEAGNNEPQSGVAETATESRGQETDRVRAEPRKPAKRVAEAVTESFSKKHGKIIAGEVSVKKSASRLKEAYDLLKRAGIEETRIADNLFDVVLAGGLASRFEMFSYDNIKKTLSGDERSDYLRGLASTEVLAMIAEGDMPSLLHEFRRIGLSQEQAKTVFENLRKILKEEGYYSEENEATSSQKGNYNAFASVSATKTDVSGRDNKTVNISETNADIGDADTLSFAKTKYVENAQDEVISFVKAGKQTGSRKNSFLRENSVVKIVMRGQNEFYVVDSDDMIIGRFDSSENAFAAAKGTIDTYGEFRVSLKNVDLLNSDLRLDTNKIFSADALNGETDFLRLITKARSYASDLQGVKYSYYTDTKATTSSLTIDLSGVDIDSAKAKALLDQIITASNNGEGIQGANGKWYVFAGQTASQRKNGIIQLMERDTYNNVVKAMRSFLSEEEIKKANVAKYMANMGTLFTPSNNDTGVKIKDAVIMKDYSAVLHKVLSDYMITNKDKDKVEIIKSLKKGYKLSDPSISDEEAQKRAEKEWATEFEAQAKVGHSLTKVWEALTIKATDGMGFIISDKQDSFQMRGPGGIKGLLIGFDWVSYLTDNMPLGAVAKDDNGNAFFRRDKDTGTIYATDVFGVEHDIKECKAILFESTVKFSGNYAAMEGTSEDGKPKGYTEFYKRLGNEDIRSVPKENVYGINNNGGMVDAMKRRGLAQMLRKEYGFTEKDINDIAQHYLYDIEYEIMKDPKKLSKLFGIDFESVGGDTTDIEAAIISCFDEGFFGTAQGERWAVDKMSKLAEDFLSGKIMTSESEAKYGWIAPDVIGLFNKIANISYKGYAGLKGMDTESGEVGEIMNANLADGKNTFIGRWPSAETNDVQIRKNRIDERYREVIERYGLDETVTYLALNDTLGLHLDNDYDGDTAVLIQGVLAEMINDIRTKSGRNVARYTAFTHSDPTGAEETEIIADTLVGVIRAGMEADKIGMFDNAIDILCNLSDKELEVGLEGYNKKEKTNYTVQEFRDLLMAQFAVAYKLNVDYAKYKYYPPEFKKVVTESLNMLDVILDKNGYAVAWADKDGNATDLTGAKKDKSGRYKKVYGAASVVPATWASSNNPNKNRAYELAVKYRQEHAGDEEGAKRKIILENSQSLGGQIAKFFTLSEHQEDLYTDYDATVAKTDGSKYSFAKFSPHDTKAIGRFLLGHGNLVTLTEAVNKRANSEYSNGKRTRTQNRIAAQKVWYNYQKMLGFDNEHFTSFVIAALNLNADTVSRRNVGSFSTFLNLDQSRWDASSKGNATKDILLRNARIVKTINAYTYLRDDLLPSLISELENFDMASKTREAKKEVKSAQSEALKSVIKDLNAELSSARAQLRAENKRLDETLVQFRRYSVNNRGRLDFMDSAQNAVSLIQDSVDKAKARVEQILNSKEAQRELSKLLTDIKISERLDALQKASDNLAAHIESVKDTLEKSARLYEEAIAKANIVGMNIDEAQAASNEITADVAAEFADAYARSEAAKVIDDIASTFGKKENLAKMNEYFGEEEESEDAVEEEPAKAKAKKEKQGESSSDLEDWKRAVATYGTYHKFVSNAVNKLVKIRTPYHQAKDATMTKKVDAVMKAYADVNNGTTADMSEVIKAFDGLKGTEYYNEEVAEELRRAQAVFESSWRTKSDRADAVANTARMVANNFVKQSKVSGDLKAFDSDAKKYGSNYDKKGLLGKIRNKLTRYQYTSTTMWKYFGGYDKNSLGYKIAKEIETATRKHMTLISQGHAFYRELVDEAGYADFYEGKTKLSSLENEKTKELFGKLEKAFGSDIKSISLNEALYLSLVYDELTEMKNRGRSDAETPYYDPFFVDGVVLNDGRVLKFNYDRHFDEQKGREVKGNRVEVNEGFYALKTLMKQSDLANKYQEITKRLVDTYGSFADDVAQKVYGTKATYYNLPMTWANLDSAGKVVSAEDMYRSWDAERVIKDPKSTLSWNNEQGNYLNLASVTSAVNTYVAKMSDFIANKEFRDYMTRMNAKRSDNMNLAGIAGQSFGADFAKWVNNFVDDITLQQENDSLLKDVRIAMQKGALIGNPSTIIKQSSSYWSAAGILSMESLLRARGTRFTFREAGAEEDVVRFRRFTNSIAPELQEVLESNNTAVDKFLNKIPGFEFLKKGITWMDSVTVNNLFTATVYDCIKNHKGDVGFDYSSKEFVEEVRDKFEEVVIYTQPMFNKMLRAEYGRTQDEMIRMLSMFRTQQTQNLNRLAVTLGEYKRAKANGEDTTDSLKALRQTVKGQVMAALSVAIFTILADAFKHKWKKYRDDDGNISAEKITERFVFNAIEAAAGTSWFADEIAKVAIDVMSGGDTNESYGISMGVISTANSAIDALQAFGKQPSLSSARYAAGYIAQLFGIPLNNAYSYLNTFAMTIAEVTGQNPKDYDDIIQLAEKNNKIDKNLKPAQRALMDTGMSKKEANNFLLSVDVNINGKLSQEEIENLYYEHPESAGTLQALWDMQGWSKSFSSMTKSAEKKRTYNSNPLFAEMDEDENKSVSKTELMNYYIDHPEIRDDLEKMYTDLGFKDFKSAVKSADKKIKFRSNPLYAEMDEDENESVSKTELAEYAIAHPEMYDTLAPLYKELGFKGTFRSAIRSAESTKIKEAAEDAFYDGDYNALFESVSKMKNGKTWLTNMVKDEYPDYENMENPLLHYLTESGLSTKQIDTAVESFGGKKLIPQYKKLRESGLSPKQSVERLDLFDANDNGSITQTELADYYKAHPEEEAIIAEFWAACGWSKTWAQYKKSKKIK